MDIEGDIEVWTEGDVACARLKADTPEGPLVVQASAPLAPIRRRVAKDYARRGIEVSGEDPSYQAAVKRLARRKALRRLSMVAPTAFRRGGLASYVARRELARRRRRRLRLDRAGKPVGAKPIGRLQPGKRRNLRRGRQWLVARRPRTLGRLTALAPALAKSVPRALPAALPTGGSGGGTAQAAPSPAARVEAPPPEDEAEVEEANADDESPQEDPETDDEGGGPDDDAEEANAEGDDGEAEDVGADLEPVHLQPGHIRAAAALLMAARRHPAARKRVHQIVQLAGEGDPVAKKAVKALKAAKNRAIRQRLAPRPPAPLPPVPKPKLAKKRLPPVARLVTAAAPVADVKPTPSWRRYLDIFASWRQGIG
jgi:hypothetical protein